MTDPSPKVEATAYAIEMTFRTGYKMNRANIRYTINMP